ncbi:MAG: hypothetical protein RIG62_16780 [Cyclobacteriaceae bacterium]
MNTRSIVFFLLFSTVSCGLMAQLLPRHRSFNLMAGYTLPKFFDKSASPLRYQGHALSVAGGFHFRKDSSTLHHIDVRFDYGQLSAFAFEFADVNYFRTEVNYSYQKRLKNIWQNHLQWYVGGSLNALWILWDFDSYTNNSINNSLYVSLSPATSLAYPFTLWNRRFQAGYSAYLPLLTFAVRPSYGTTRLPGFLDDERDEPVAQFFESGQLTSFNKFFRFSNTFSLEYLLSNNNRLRLSYEWNYLRYSEPRLVKAASHNIVIGTMFNF